MHSNYEIHRSFCLEQCEDGSMKLINLLPITLQPNGDNVIATGFLYTGKDACGMGLGTVSNPEFYLKCNEVSAEIPLLLTLVTANKQTYVIPKFTTLALVYVYKRSLIPLMPMESAVTFVPEPTPEETQEAPQPETKQELPKEEIPKEESKQKDARRTLDDIALTSVERALFQCFPETSAENYEHAKEILDSMERKWMRVAEAVMTYVRRPKLYYMRDYYDHEYYGSKFVIYQR